MNPLMIITQIGKLKQDDHHEVNGYRKKSGLGQFIGKVLRGII